MPSIAYIMSMCQWSVFNTVHKHKMKFTKFEIRVLLKHYWKQDYKSAAMSRRIYEVEGVCVGSERVAQQWFQHFNTGENPKDLPVLEDLNYGILRIHAEFWKKIRKKRYS